jgi:hypothetical protein
MMKHEWKGGTTPSTPDNPPEGYSYCEQCGVEENDENKDGECLPEIAQISFHQAVYDDPDMTPEMKLYWLKMCADQYLEQLEVSERAVNILRGGMEVIERLHAEGQLDMIVPSCGVALRATTPKRGHKGLEEKRICPACNVDLNAKPHKRGCRIERMIGEADQKQE